MSPETFQKKMRKETRDRSSPEEGSNPTGLVGEDITVDSTHLKAYSQRSLDNRKGRSDPDARAARAGGASSLDTEFKPPRARCEACPQLRSPLYLARELFCARVGA